MVMPDRALANIEILLVTGATVERMVNNVVACRYLDPACPDEVDEAMRVKEALNKDMGETSLREEPTGPFLSVLAWVAIFRTKWLPWTRESCRLAQLSGT